jgi:phosphinothricin acetyltransferase
MKIRPAEPRDAEAIAAIHNQGIAERQATFETRERTAADVEMQMIGTLPFLVAEDDGRVVGWAKLSPFSERECYAGVNEASIYLDRAARGRGVGRALLSALEDAARATGHWKIIGLLFPENTASVALFRAAGYREVGTYARHGRLDGAWRDVVLVEKAIAGDA